MTHEISSIPTYKQYQIDRLRKASRWRQAPLINSLLSSFSHNIPAIDELSRCGKPRSDGLGRNYKDRPWGDIVFKAPRYKCGLPYCPRCAPRSRQKEAKRMWNRITSVTKPTVDSISWLTIRGDILPLGSSFLQAKTRMKKEIEVTLRRYLPQCFLSAQFSLAPRKDGTTMLHIHGALIHPADSRRKVESTLRKKFGKGRVLQLKKLESDNVSEEWLQSGDPRKASGIGRYSCDARLEGMDWYGDELDIALAGQILSWESIRGRKREGLRIEIGFRRKRKQDEQSLSAQVISSALSLSSMIRSVGTKSASSFDESDTAEIQG